jgi:hypothetical protein
MEPFRLWEVSQSRRRQCWRGCVLGSIIYLLAHLTIQTLLQQEPTRIFVRTPFAIELISHAQWLRQVILINAKPMLLLLFFGLLWMQFDRAPGALQFLCWVLSWCTYILLLIASMLIVIYGVLLVLERTVLGIVYILVIGIAAYLWARSQSQSDGHSPRWGDDSLIEKSIAGFFAALIFLFVTSVGW